ncbi:MAG: heme-binding protein [Myxococcota bacterium]
MNPTIHRPTISLELAQRLIEAAEAHARTTGLAIATTVVDESGILKAFSRMDHAALIAVGASRKKALTAVGFGIPTGQAWHDFIKDDPILMNGAGQLDDFILLGGGLPIRVANVLVGAIGVSGGHYAQDEACAKAALSVLEPVA